MTRKRLPEERYRIESLERMDAIHKELRHMNDYLDDMLEARKAEKTELSFILSLVGVGISVSSLLVRSLSGDSRILIIGGGISFLLLFNVVSFVRRIAKSRPIPIEIKVMLLILFLASAYSIALGIGIIE